MTSVEPHRLLFITWDGPQTSYLESLFLPILSRLKAAGCVPHVLQFGWGDEQIWQRRMALCQTARIPYRHVNVFRSLGGMGAFLSALLGARHIRSAIKDWKIDTLMPRSLMPALAVLRLGRHEKAALRIVFDADGLAADERVDFTGMSPHGLVYRLLRDIEAEMLRQSDAVLSRTPAAAEILLARAGAGIDPSIFHVVSNGIDPAPFYQAIKNRQGAPRGLTLAYCGSIGAQYRLEDMLNLVVQLRSKIPDLRFNIYTRATAEAAQELSRNGLQNADWIRCEALDPKDIPAALAACDVGIALRLRHFSTRAVAPIKIGEYLMAGLPVIGTPGVGDTAPLLESGVFRPAGEGPNDIADLAEWLEGTILPHRTHWRQKCYDAGVAHFSIEATMRQYLSAIQSACRSGRHN